MSDGSAIDAIRLGQLSDTDRTSVRRVRRPDRLRAAAAVIPAVCGVSGPWWRPRINGVRGVRRLSKRSQGLALEGLGGLSPIGSTQPLLAGRGLLHSQDLQLSAGSGDYADPCHRPGPTGRQQRRRQPLVRLRSGPMGPLHPHVAAERSAVSADSADTPEGHGLCEGNAARQIRTNPSPGWPSHTTAGRTATYTQAGFSGPCPTLSSESGDSANLLHDSPVGSVRRVR